MLTEWEGKVRFFKVKRITNYRLLILYNLILREHKDIFYIDFVNFKNRSINIDKIIYKNNFTGFNK